MIFLTKLRGIRDIVFKTMSVYLASKNPLELWCEEIRAFVSLKEVSMEEREGGSLWSGSHLSKQKLGGKGTFILESKS